jgi:hypothetical protein
MRQDHRVAVAVGHEYRHLQAATVVGTITYLSLYLQNTLGYSPVQGGLRLLPIFLAAFSIALLTGRLIGKVAMRVLLGVAMAAVAFAVLGAIAGFSFRTLPSQAGAA